MFTGVGHISPEIASTLKGGFHFMIFFTWNPNGIPVHLVFYYMRFGYKLFLRGWALGSFLNAGAPAYNHISYHNTIYIFACALLISHWSVCGRTHVCTCRCSFGFGLLHV